MTRAVAALGVAALVVTAGAAGASAAQTATAWVPAEPFTTNVGAGANWTVSTVVPLVDGSLLVGGQFNTFDGVAARGLVRLSPDGTVDPEFSAALGAGSAGGTTFVNSVVVADDGDLIVAGNFLPLDGGPSALVRLNADGSADTDTDFNTNLGTGFGPGAGWTQRSVASIIEQPNGGLVVSGMFTSLNGDAVPNVARLNADGTRDAAWDANLEPNWGTGGNVSLRAVGLADGDVMLVGAWVSGASTVVRINPDGTRDTAFNANLGGGANSTGTAAVGLSDGGALVGGAFSSFNSVPSNGLVRLNPDGTVDETFQAAIEVEGVPAAQVLTELEDGDILVGGVRIINGGTSLLNGFLVRLNADGSLDADSGWDVDWSGNGLVSTIAVLPGGDILIGGVDSDGSGALVRYAPVTAEISPIANQTTTRGSAVDLPVVVTATDDPTGESFTFTAAGLPDGLTIDQATGVIAGTPTKAGTFDVTVTATTVNPARAALTVDTTFTWSIATLPTITDDPTGTPQDGTVGEPWSHTLVVDGLPTPAVAITAGELPPGLSLGPVTARSAAMVPIAGTPTAAGEFTFTLTATNAAGSASIDLTVTVLPAENPGAPTDPTDPGTPGDPAAPTDPTDPGTPGTPGGGGPVAATGGWLVDSGVPLWVFGVAAAVLTAAVGVLLTGRAPRTARHAR